MDAATKKRPDWDELYRVAEVQSGYFTTRQAEACGFSSELLIHHKSTGRLIRARRSVYRLRRFPADEHEELAVVWLWSDQAGVFSHETALFLHELSDVLPTKFHLTVPRKWSQRRLRVPKDVQLHYEDIMKRDRLWVGPVPVTSPQHSIVDCIAAHVSLDLLEQAVFQAEKRGLVSRSQAQELRRTLGVKMEIA